MNENITFAKNERKIMGSNGNLLGVIKKILRWWKFIMIISGLAAALSIAVSLFLPDEYKSSTVFYPKNLNIYDSEYLFGTGAKDKIQSIFGGNQDLHRVISLAGSNELKDGLINEFKLWDHYDIDTSRRYWHFKLMKKLDSRTEVMKSEHDNIELSVWDENPKFAAALANRFADKLEEAYEDVVKQRNQSNLEIARKRLGEIEHSLTVLVDTLQGFRDTTSISYKVVRSKYNSVQKDYLHWSALVNQYKAANEYDFNGFYYVERALPSEKKDKPVRWLIVVSSVLAAFFLSMLAVLIIEQIRSIKEELKNEA